MSKIPELKTNYAEEFSRYTQAADYNTVTGILPALIKGVAQVIQSEIESPLMEILASNNIGSATGQLLDYWGELVDEGRKGRSDDTYRIAIRAKISRNLSNGTWNDLLNITLSLYGDSSIPIIIDEPGSSRYIVDFQGNLIQDNEGNFLIDQRIGEPIFVADNQGNRLLDAAGNFIVSSTGISTYRAEATMEVLADITRLKVPAINIFEIINNAKSAGVLLHYIYLESDVSDTFEFSDTSALVSNDNRKGLSDLVASQGGRFAGVLSSSDSRVLNSGDSSTSAPSASSWSSGFDSGFGG